MSVKDVLKAQLETTEYQLVKVFDGLTEEQFDLKATPVSMTPRETAAHLTECYLVAVKAAAGEEVAWGTFKSVQSTGPGLLNEMLDARIKAVQVLLADAEKNADSISNYLVLHDCYHVGQIATVRMVIGGWDPYCIYKED